MGLRDLLARWTKGEDARAVDRAERESQMSPVERANDQEDFEARKDDVAAESSWAGRAAEDAADGELEA